MPQALDLEKGVQETARLISRIPARPILVAVYGHNGAGKSYIIAKLADVLKEQGFEPSRSGTAPDRSTFEGIRDYPGFYRNRVSFFHCAWPRPAADSDLFADEDPNILAPAVLGRQVDVNIAIYSPKICSVPSGGYDIIIANPDSRRAW